MPPYALSLASRYCCRCCCLLDCLNWAEFGPGKENSAHAQRGAWNFHFRGCSKRMPARIRGVLCLFVLCPGLCGAGSLCSRVPLLSMFVRFLVLHALFGNFCSPKSPRQAAFVSARRNCSGPSLMMRHFQGSSLDFKACWRSPATYCNAVKYKIKFACILLS